MNTTRNIFHLHQNILNDYKLYIHSFINIADDKIRTKANEEFNSGNLYPEPLVQFNPSFESGGQVEDLVNDGVLVQDFRSIFYDDRGDPRVIYKHQAQAIRKRNEDQSFVVTSGTGSGKSLAISRTFSITSSNTPANPASRRSSGSTTFSGEQ